MVSSWLIVYPFSSTKIEVTLTHEFDQCLCFHKASNSDQEQARSHLEVDAIEKIHKQTLLLLHVDQFSTWRQNLGDSRPVCVRRSYTFQKLRLNHRILKISKVEMTKAKTSLRRGGTFNGPMRNAPFSPLDPSSRRYFMHFRPGTADEAPGPASKIQKHLATFEGSCASPKPSYSRIFFGNTEFGKLGQILNWRILGCSARNVRLCGTWP